MAIIIIIVSLPEQQHVRVRAWHRASLQLPSPLSPSLPLPSPSLVPNHAPSSRSLPQRRAKLPPCTPLPRAQRGRPRWTCWTLYDAYARRRALRAATWTKPLRPERTEVRAAAAELPLPPQSRARAPSPRCRALQRTPLSTACRRDAADCRRRRRQQLLQRTRGDERAAYYKASGGRWRPSALSLRHGSGRRGRADRRRMATRRTRRRGRARRRGSSTRRPAGAGKALLAVLHLERAAAEYGWATPAGHRGQ